MALTKNELAERVRAELEIPKSQAFDTVETLIEIIKRTLRSGEDLLISGFGKFSLKSKRERRGRNPATGEELMLDPRRVVTFKCSGSLRECLNNLNQKGNQGVKGEAGNISPKRDIKPR